MMSQSLTLQIKPRLGLINYINCLPVVLPITRALANVNAQVIFGQPSELNALFATGALDYGAMSAFAFLEQKEHLTLIPTLSISSLRAVSSVLLFSKRSIAKDPPMRICVPGGSATSINAMILMLSQFSKEKATLIRANEPVLDDDSFDAALVIGDRALIVDEDWSKEYFRYDLGEWWHETFNLPMVFGVFAVRTAWYKGNSLGIGDQALVEELGEGLANAAKLGLNDCFEAVLEEAETRTGIVRDRLVQYFRKDLDFSWSDRHQAAIDKYELLCSQNGMLEDKKVLA